MSSVCRPVHCVDLGKMTFESTLRLHGQPRQLLDALSGNIADWEDQISSPNRDNGDVLGVAR